MTGTCRYEVFPQIDEPFAAEGDDAVAEMIEAGAVWTPFTRNDAPARFVPPRFGVSVDADPKWRHPVTPADSAVTTAIAQATRGYAVSADVGDAEGLRFLSACLNLTRIIAATCDGVVVDRTSDIGYTAEQHDALIEQPYLRDMLVVEAIATGATFELRTAGMHKYAAHELVIESVAASDLELGKTILFDNVANYAAFKGRLQPGQTMQYQRQVPASTWFFEQRGDGRLRVVDYDSEGKRPLPTLDHCLGVFRPLFAKVRGAVG